MSRETRTAKPTGTVPCTARPSSSVLRFPPPRMAKVLSLFLAVALAALLRPATSSSTSPELILVTSCSGQQSPSSTSSSSHAATSWESEVATFLAAVCAGAVGAAHMSHSMSSSSVAGARANRRTVTTYAVAQCRPDCAACLAAASSRLVIASLFPEDDEYTATVYFNATRAPRLASPHGGDGGKAAARWLLAASGKKSTTSSHMCRGVGVRSGAAGGGLRIYGLTRCAAGVSCAACRRCLRGALAAAEREYNGSAGMQVLRLSCMTRYESYPFYKTAPRRRLMSGTDIFGPTVCIGNNCTRIAEHPAPAPPAQNHTPSPFPPPAPPADHHTPPPFPPAGEGHQPPPALPEDHTPLPPPAAIPPDQTRVTQQRHGKTPKILITLIVSVATGLMVTSVILVIIWYHRKQAPARRGHAIDGMQGDNNMYEQVEEQASMEEKGEDGERTTCQLYSYQVLENATHHFSNSNKLGSGGFGTVFRGTLENGKEVAVKRIRDSKRNIEELEREVSIVSDLHHKNLVRFLGYCFQEEGRFLVYEYVPNNSLEKFWYKACFQSQKLDWTTWFNIIKGVARGLQFLHDKGIIHRDLKPHNVLLDENFNPKIADFDLMRMYDKQKTHESTEKVAGTFGYMAPECTSGRKFLLSIKSDVYSYGVLVLEIITGHKIYTFEGQNSEGLVEYVWQHWTEKRVSDVVDGDLGVDGQEHALRQALRCVHVALLCVQSDRSKRPTMGQVIAMLSSDFEQASLQEPSLPGYVVRPTVASGPVWLPCLGRR